MNDNHATKYLLSLPDHTAVGTPDNLRRLLSAVDTGGKQLDIIKILGETGKSTVAALLSSLLTHSGISHGCVFLAKRTDPRLSINIDGKTVGHGPFAKAVTKVWQAANICGIQAPSYDEILLAAAHILFSEEGCRAAIVVLSAENPCSAASGLPLPSLSVVTSSTKQTVERMLPLLDAGSEMVSPPQTLDVYNLLRGHAAARFNIPTQNDLRDVSVSGHTLSFACYGDKYLLPTPALYHMHNAACVIEAFRALERQKKNVTKKALETALSQSGCYKSFRLFSLSPAWLLDAATSPYRLGELEKAVSALPHLFDGGFDMIAETDIAELCERTFGERIKNLLTLDKATAAKHMKTLPLPDKGPLIILGSKPFLTEINRALDARFLYG